MKPSPSTDDGVLRSEVEETRTVGEARLHALLEAAIDGIISIDDRGLIQTLNPATERLFGYSRAEMVGRNVKMLMPPPYEGQHDSYLASYLATGEKKVIGLGREVVGRRKDGSTFPMELSVAEGRVGPDRIFVGIVRDITERARAEAAMRKSKAELEQALAEVHAKSDELKAMTQQLWQAAKLASVGELAAGIAHELNNPLGTVSLRIESVLARTSPDDPNRRALEIIEQETKRMGDLVSNLLQFSRRNEEQSSTVDIGQELTRTVELIHHQFRKRLINVVQEVAPDTPLLYADRQKLRQVFLNLLSNAGDAMPRGGTLTLRASGARLDGGTPAIRVEFSDTGAGIPAEHLAKVMDPFFTTKAEGQGTGLGLAICRRIVQEHRGAIEVLSEVGQGTTVRILLPASNATNVQGLFGAGFVH